MADQTLKLVQKYLKDSGYLETYLALERQSQVSNVVHARQVEFFRRIVLNGDFDEAIKFLNTFRDRLAPELFKAIMLTLLKQRLYQLIQSPSQIELKTLFQRDLAAICTDEEYQSLFTCLTCRSVTELPQMGHWSVLKGRLGCFEEIRPTIESTLHVKSSYNEPTEEPLKTIIEKYFLLLDKNEKQHQIQVDSKELYDIQQQFNRSKLTTINKHVNQPKHSNQSKVIHQQKTIYSSNKNDEELHQDLQKNEKVEFQMQFLPQQDKKKGKNPGEITNHSKMYQNYTVDNELTSQTSQTFKRNQLIVQSAGQQIVEQQQQPPLNKQKLQNKSQVMMQTSQHQRQKADLYTYEPDIEQEQLVPELDHEAESEMNYLRQSNLQTERLEGNQNFTFSQQAYQEPIKKFDLLKLATIVDAKAIRTCQFSPGGSLFALGTNSSVLKIFDVELLYQKRKPMNIAPIYQIDGLHSKSIFSLDWSSTQAGLITSSNDLNIKLTEINSKFSEHRTTVIGKHDSCVRMVKFTPSEDSVVSCGDDALIKLWDLKKAKLLLTLKGHTSGVSAFKIGGPSTIYSVGKDSTLREWDLRSGQCEMASKPQQSEMTFIASHTDQIVTSHRNGTISFFNKGLDLHYSIKLHEEEIRSIEGLKGEDLLLTGSFDGYLSLFSEKEYHNPNVFKHNDASEEDKVVYATFQTHPSCAGFASTSTLGLCHLFTYE